MTLRGGILVYFVFRFVFFCFALELFAGNNAANAVENLSQAAVAVYKEKHPIKYASKHGKRRELYACVARKPTAVDVPP